MKNIKLPEKVYENAPLLGIGNLEERKLDNMSSYNPNDYNLVPQYIYPAEENKITLDIFTLNQMINYKN